MRPLDLSRPWTWILTIAWPPGQQLRLSSQRVAITDANSKTWQYEGGLPPLRWRAEAPLFDVSVGQGTLSVDLELGEDCAALADVNAIEESPVELAIHFLGETWEQRLRVFTGHIDRAVPGVDEQVVSVDIIEESFQDAGLLCAAEWTIELTDWADAVDSALGKVYPRVYGTPGLYRGTAGAAAVAGSPCWVVRATAPVLVAPITALIAGHHVAAPQVTILNATTGVSVVKSVINTSLSEGTSRRLVATVNLFPLTDFDDIVTPTAATKDDEYYVIWTDGGASYTADRGSAILGAGELLEQAFGFASILVDRARVAAARIFLDAYRLDTYLNDTISPWEWIRRVMISLVPMSVLSGPDGIYPVCWRLDAGPADAVVHLEIGRNAAWASRDGPGDARRYSEVRVSFAPDDTSGDLQRMVRVRPEDRTSDDTGSSSHARRAIQGLRNYQSGDTALLLEEEIDQSHDANTAWLRAHHVLALGLRRGRVVEVDVDRDLSGLEQGDVVTLTGDGKGWAQRVAHVQAVEWASAYTRLALYVPYQ